MIIQDAMIIQKSNSIPINLNKFTIIILIVFRTLACMLINIWRDPLMSTTEIP